MHIMACVIGAMLGAITVGLVQAPPTSLISVSELDGVVAAGGRLELVFDVRRNRVCPATVERQLWQWRTVGDETLRYIVPLPSLGMANSPPDQNKSIVSIEIPQGLRPGTWYYTSRSFFHCSPVSWLFGGSPTKSPDVRVDIKAE